MALCTVSGSLLDIGGVGIENANVTAKITTPYFVGTDMLLPGEVTTLSSAAGAWSLDLTQGASVIVLIDYPPNVSDGKRRLSYSIIVPAAPTAAFSTLAVEL